MRLAAALVLFLAAPAAAQSPPTRAQAPPTAHRVVLVGTALGGTALALVAGPFAPLATAPVVYWTGHGLGHDAPFGRVVVDWGFGVAAGLATYHGLNYVYGALNDGAIDLSADLGNAATGLAVSAVVTALLYEADVPALDVAPVVVRTADGGAAGLSVRVGL